MAALIKNFARHRFLKVFLHLYKFSIQIKLNRLVLSTYEECRMCIDIWFHPKFHDISQVMTYGHMNNVYQCESPYKVISLKVSNPHLQVDRNSSV